MVDTTKTVQLRSAAVFSAYQRGMFGPPRIPEDTAPTFKRTKRGLEDQLAYFTLPMSLNYRRSSQQLWNAALSTYTDASTRPLFSVSENARRGDEYVYLSLMKYRLAMQPVRHTHNWIEISNAVNEQWGGFAQLLAACSYDFLTLREVVQYEHKKRFPYLSGPKLFNYWAYILRRNCGVDLTNDEHIDIAVDSHVRKASGRIGLISEAEATSLPPAEIARRWRVALAGTSLRPVDLNVPLWMWSRSGFVQFQEPRP